MSDLHTFDTATQQRIDSVTSRFDSFIAAQKHAVQRAAEEHQHTAAQLRSEHRELAAQLESLHNRETTLQQQLDREINDVNASDSRIAELKLRATQLESERQGLNTQLAELKSKVQTRRQELSKLKLDRQHQGELDLPETMVYEQILGMKIQGLKEDVLKLVFTNITQDNKEHVLELDVSGEYKVQSTIPTIPVETTLSLEKELNETRDLTRS